MQCLLVGGEGQSLSKEESREKCKLYIVHFVVVRSSHCDAAESIKTKLSDTVFARWRHGLLNDWIGN